MIANFIHEREGVVDVRDVTNNHIPAVGDRVSVTMGGSTYHGVVVERHFVYACHDIVYIHFAG